MFYDVLVVFSEQYEKYWKMARPQSVRVWESNKDMACRPSKWLFCTLWLPGCWFHVWKSCKWLVYLKHVWACRDGDFFPPYPSDRVQRHDPRFDAMCSAWDISCTCWKFRHFWLRHRWNQHGHPYWKARRSESNVIHVIHVILTTDCIGRFFGQLGWYLLECIARLESSTPLQRLADSSQWGCWLLLGNHAGDGPRFLRNRVVVSHVKMWWWKSKAHRFYTKKSPFEITAIVLYIPIYIYTYTYMYIYIHTSYHCKWGCASESTGEVINLHHLWRSRYILHWLLSCRRLSQEPKKIGIQRCVLDPLVKVHFSWVDVSGVSFQTLSTASGYTQSNLWWFHLRIG